MTWTGTVIGLHIAPRSFLPMGDLDQVTLITDKGIDGDRYSKDDGFYSDRPEPGRQLTLFESEVLEALARDHGITLAATDHRRNVTTRSVPVNHLVGRRFRIGQAVAEGTRLSVPCRHIEQITGQEIFAPLINRSGLHARILDGGIVRRGDRIVPL